MSSRLGVAAALLLFSSLFAEAQSFIFPGKTVAAPCTGCGGAQEGLLTYPYNDPLVHHTGRYVDSSTTINVQNIGMRTVRADSVRLSPATDRIYIEYGEAVSSHVLSTFFTTKLAAPMVTVDTMNTGQAYGRYGKPLEKIAAVNSFFYAESPKSGWTTEVLDAQMMLDDFDADDRGYVYIGTPYFGWGVAHGSQVTDGKHMPFVSQIRGAAAPVRSRDGVIAFRNGTTYYAVIAGPSSSSSYAYALYDVTTPATPTLLATRSGTQYGVREWARYDAGGRLAFVNADGHIRIYDYAGFVAGAAPLADLTPSTGMTFRDVAFDESGVLWATESTSSSGVLRKLTPTGNAYTNETLDVLGPSYSASTLDAGGGYIAVSGTVPVDGYRRRELRLLNVENGVPQLLDTDEFFLRFYHYPPAGYAPALDYVAFSDVRLVTQGGRTYLMYSAIGLGDVFELGAATDARVATTLSLSSDPNPGIAGQSVTLTATLTPASSADAIPTGSIRFRAGNTILGTGTLTAGSGGTYRATYTGAFTAGSHTLAADYAGDTNYRPAVSANHTHVSCDPAAIATQPASLTIMSGEQATLSVAATGTATLTYQWYRGASGTTTDPVSGATSATLSISPSSTTSYWVRVTNSCGTVDSAAATVTVNVCSAPSVTKQPASVSIFAGQSTILSVTASSATAMSYQWYRGSSGTTTSPISGATAASLKVTLTKTTSYWARVTNSCGFVNSSTATVTVKPIPAPVPFAQKARDFNGDARADVFWRNGTSGANVLWFMNGGTRTQTASQTVSDLAWSVAAIGDTNLNGRADVMWRKPSTGNAVLWLMNGASVVSRTAQPIMASSELLVGSGDFDGDGRADLLWRNTTTGANTIWLMNGTTATAVPTSSATDQNWAPAAFGDFNGDNRDDIFWRHRVTGATSMWFMNGATATIAAVATVTDLNWAPRGAGDFNGDGRDDLLWRNGATGANTIWFMNGTARTASALSTTVVAWRPVAIGDFNGNGTADIMWRNMTTGDVRTWLMSGVTISSNVLSASMPDAAWQVAEAK